LKYQATNLGLGMAQDVVDVGHVYSPWSGYRERRPPHPASADGVVLNAFSSGASRCRDFAKKLANRHHAGPVLMSAENDLAALQENFSFGKSRYIRNDEAAKPVRSAQRSSTFSAISFQQERTELFARRRRTCGVRPLRKYARRKFLDQADHRYRERQQAIIEAPTHDVGGYDLAVPLGHHPKSRENQ
jgi:hypothetical protein